MFRTEIPAFGGRSDVAVIGASFGGLSAALMLARGRRRVALFDTGATRNRFSAHSHGLYGHDGTDPQTLRLTARAQVLAYPTVALHELAVVDAVADADGFRLTDAAGQVHLTRRLVLAYGMRDQLPPLPGLAECWGVTAVHCPYCHGYELADRPTGVLHLQDSALHQVQMLPHWTNDLALFLHGQPLADDLRAGLAARGVAVHDPVVTALHHAAGRLHGVQLADGQSVALQALYLHCPATPASDLAERLGCALEQGPFGPHLAVDAMMATSVLGVFAAGDLARPTPSAPQAVGDGTRAGVACHRSLMDLG